MTNIPISNSISNQPIILQSLTPEQVRRQAERHRYFDDDSQRQSTGEDVHGQQ